jgi:hypothetical protein
MDVDTINNGIRGAKEKLALARKQHADGEHVMALDTLVLAQEAIAKAGLEFEQADVKKVDEIVDIERWVEEEQSKNRMEVALAKGNAALQSARKHLSDEDVERSEEEGAEARACFEQARAELEQRASKETKQSIKEELQNELEKLKQEHTKTLEVLGHELAEEIQRQSCVRAGDAALAAARNHLMCGDIVSAKEERATAAFAFHQSKADRQKEMQWINDQIVEAERQALIASGDAELKTSENFLHVKDFDGARMAHRAAVSAFEHSNDMPKLMLAAQLSEDISVQEMQHFLTLCDARVGHAQQMLLGSNDLIGAKDASDEALRDYRQAKTAARQLLLAREQDIVNIKRKLEALVLQHAPCKARFASLQRQADAVEVDMQAIRAQLSEMAQLRNTMAGRQEIAKQNKLLAIHEAKEADILGPLREAQRDRDAQELVEVSVRRELHLAEECKMTLEAQLKHRAKALESIECDLQASRCLLYGCSLAEEAIKYRDVESEKEAIEKFTEGLELVQFVGLRADLLYHRSAALARMGALVDGVDNVWSKYEKALEDALECVKIHPMSPRSYDCKATALRHLGRSVEANDAERLSMSLQQLRTSPHDPQLKESVQNNFRTVLFSEFEDKGGPVRRQDFEYMKVSCMDLWW